jgi:putative transposase
VSVYQAPSSWKDRFQLIRSSFLQAEGLPFSSVLSEERIEEVFGPSTSDQVTDGEQKSVYTVAITLWAFLSQILFKDEHRSCRAAVSRVSTLLVTQGHQACSKNTGAYCRARAQLPTAGIRQLGIEAARNAEQELPEEWLWLGRHVKMADGFTVSMPDTVENQETFPQHATQKQGLGFPLARCVALFSLATGMALDLEIGPYTGKETGETALLRKMLPGLASGDILLADCYYCSYFMIALLMALNVDCVLRVHQRRSVDFQSGKRLGRKDHSVCWQRPLKPTWMDDETYAEIPESIEIREIEVPVHKPGFRPTSLVVVTTLTDSKAYTTKDIADLFRCRWLVEQDIRALKCNLGIDILRGKTPDMVRKEVYAAMLAYNLIHESLRQAAQQAELKPRHLSFTHALQTIVSSWSNMPVSTPVIQAALIASALQGYTQQLVGRRPDRVEPRAVKRRPKPHKILTEPRHVARAKLMPQHA